VTWALILLTGAAAFGSTTVRLDVTQEELKELQTDAKEWTRERTRIASDLRVTTSKVADLVKSYGKIVDIVDRVETAVTRLETVTRNLDP
jgi:hypothetical protein